MKHSQYRVPTTSVVLLQFFFKLHFLSLKEHKCTLPFVNKDWWFHFLLFDFRAYLLWSSESSRAEASREMFSRCWWQFCSERLSCRHASSGEFPPTGHGDYHGRGSEKGHQCQRKGDQSTIEFFSSWAEECNVCCCFTRFVNGGLLNNSKSF